MRTVLLCLLVTWTASGPAAQAVHDGTDHYCTLRVDDGVARSGAPLASEALVAARRAGGASRTVTTVGAQATFEVRYTGFTAAAEAAFQSAVDVWAAHLASPVTVRIEAQFGPLADNVLGAAGPRITANFGAGQPQTWYPFALADALLGRDAFPPVEDDPNTPTDEADYRPDIEATFNSAFSDFYYGTDGNPPAGQFDFRSIVLHELGHGLGFVGSGEYDNGIISADEPDPECDGVEGHGCWGIQAGAFFAPIIYDRLVEDASGVAMTSAVAYPQNSEALGDLLTSNGITTTVEEKEIFVDGVTIRAANGDAPAPIYAPRPAEAGSSFSHWDEYIFPPSVGSNALMTPGLARGEAYADPGALTCALFDDLGWTLTPSCTALFPTSEAGGPEAVTLSLVPLGANPFRESTAFHLVAPGADVSVRVVDALGRTVAALYDGPVGPSGVRLNVDGRALAPGVYVVRVRGGGEALGVSVVRAR